MKSQFTYWPGDATLAEYISVTAQTSFTSSGLSVWAMRWLSAPSCRPEISPTTHLDYRFVGPPKRHRSRIGRAAQTERSKCEARIDAEVGLILIWGGCTRRFAHDLSVRIAGIYHLDFDIDNRW